METILITGSCGFIFGNFIRKAIFDKRPYKFHSIDKINNPNSTSTIYLNKDHKFHICDITDKHVMNILFEYIKPDIVIHGAAEACVDASLTNPTAFIESNVLGTQIVVNNCIKHKVKKLIQVSTDEILGHLDINDKSWTEEAPMNPRNPYAASKAAAELVVKAAHTSFGLNYNIIRMSNNYGPRQTTDKLIPRTIKCILNNEKIPIYGKGLQQREWTYVTDSYNAIFDVIEKGKLNETYNISSNQECTNIEIVQKICNIVGKGHNLVSFIEDPRGNAHDFRYSLNVDKIKSIGWEPQIKLPEGLVLCVDWYLKNHWWFKQ